MSESVLRNRPIPHELEPVPPQPMPSDRADSPNSAKRSWRENKLKHVAAHAAVGATLGGIVLGPIGIAIGLGKGLALGAIMSEERISGPAQRLGRSIEPDVVREMRIRISDDMARVRFHVQDKLSSTLRGQRGAEPCELRRACSDGLAYASPLLRASSAPDTLTVATKPDGCHAVRRHSVSCGPARPPQWRIHAHSD